MVEYMMWMNDLVCYWLCLIYYVLDVNVVDVCMLCAIIKLKLG